MTSIGFLLFAAIVVAPCAASAEAVDGSGALALAALVGGVSPLLGEPEKAALTKLLNGQANFQFPPGKKITVQAEKVTCKSSNVDIKAHSCDLVFGKQNVAMAGRSAHELYATLIEIGVPQDLAAGSVFEAVSNLKCTIDPNEVIQNAGGGAHCQCDPPK